MDDPFFVHNRQGIHDWHQQIKGIIERKFATLGFYMLLKADTVHIFHDKIGGAVFFKVTVDTDNIGIANELGHGLGFLQKGASAVSEIFAPFTVEGCDRGAVGSGCHGIREEFLDGGQLAGLVVPGGIGNAKSALTKDSADDVASVQDGSSGKAVGCFDMVELIVESADRADLLIVQGIVEAIAAETVHRAPLLPSCIIYS